VSQVLQWLSSTAEVACACGTKLGRSTMVSLSSPKQLSRILSPNVQAAVEMSVTAQISWTLIYDSVKERNTGLLWRREVR
jgi:hypothetical protein